MMDEVRWVKTEEGEKRKEEGEGKGGRGGERISPPTSSI